ncbi:MAG: hypothetical protein JKY99_03535, partial [Rhizobiales bacterium]|nr:hypothetical protein [Hyphomicrobiales bacterium]
DIDVTSIAVKSLSTDGTTTTTTTNYVGAGSALADKSDQSIGTVSGNGLVITALSDANGDGIFDSKRIDETVLNVDGSKTKTVTSFNGDGTTQTGKIVSTVSDDGLTTTISTFIGDASLPYQEQTEIRSIGADGSTTTTTSLTGSDTTLISSATAIQSADRLVTTVSQDTNGDGTNDRITSGTKNADGSVTTIVSAYSSNGVLESKTTQVISADRLTTTSTTDFDGNGTVDISSTEVVTLELDGSTEINSFNYNADGTQRDRITTTVSADTLTTTTVWRDEDNLPTKTQTQTTVVQADGTRQQTTTILNGDSTLNRETISTTNADGTQLRLTEDVDGDGTVNHTIVKTQHADGTETTSKMEGALASASGREYGIEGGQYTTISADGLVETIQYDADGDGLAETQTIVANALNADGSKITTTTRADLTGGSAASATPSYSVTIKDITIVTISADGHTVTREWDKDGDGTSETSKTMQTVYLADGSTAGTTSYFDGTNLTSRETTTTSADAQTITIERDVDGSGTNDEISTKTLVYLTNGDLVETVTNTTSTSSLISKTETATSFDGKTVTIQSDPEGTGAFTQSETSETITRSDESTIVTRSIYDGGVLRDKSVTSMSADGYKTVVERDSDGDGNIDQREIVLQFSNGSTKTTVTDFDASGAIKSEYTNILSINGQILTSEKDENGDGITDQTTSHIWSNSAEGSSTEVLKIYRVSEEASNGTFSAIAPVLEREVTITTSADGLTQTSTVDINGDGTIDETTIVEESIDGSVVTTKSANALAQSVVTDPDEVSWASTIAAGSPIVAATTITTTSANGLTKTIDADYDGNGTFEHEEIWTSTIDGSQLASITDSNSSGTVIATGTITISADQRTTVLTRDTNIDGTVDGSQTTVREIDGNVIKTIAGSAANDTLNGGDGDQTLIGGAGADTLNGDEGTDTASYASSLTGLSANLGAPSGNTGDAAGDSYVSIENLEGTDFADTLTGDSNDNEIRGGTGIDTLDGGAGDDHLYGGSGADILVGGAGDDRLTGGAGGDSLDGGTDDDVAIYRASSSGVSVDLVSGFGSGGDAAGDVLTGIESLEGSGFDDTLSGDGGDNSLSGGSGDDLLTGRGGADTLDGGLGTDIAVYDGALSDYEVLRHGDQIRVTRLSDSSDIDELRNIETLRFSDGDIDLAAEFPDVGPVTARILAGTPASGRIATAVSGMAYELESGPEHGLVTVNADGSYSLAAEAGYDGLDSFVVKATHASGMAELITVDVAVATGLVAGAETLVNTNTSGNQHVSQVAGLTGGGHVVVWADSNNLDGDGYSVRGQLYNVDGSELGSEFQVNTYSAGDQSYPSVTSLSDGGFIVSWTSENQDGSGTGIFGQRYDSSGATVGAEIAINSGMSSGNQFYPGIASLSDGGFVATWQDANGTAVRGRVFDANGAQVGSVFQANTYNANNQTTPSVTGLVDGGFIICWSSWGQDGSQGGIFGQRYDASGVRAGSEFAINTGVTSGDQWDPSIASLSDGGFVVTWT